MDSDDFHENPHLEKIRSSNFEFRNKPKFKFSNPQAPEVPAKEIYSVIPAKAGIQNRLKILDSGSPGLDPGFACPE
jgi:hypothetical protein